MKRTLLIVALLLTGCATTQHWRKTQVVAGGAQFTCGELDDFGAGKPGEGDSLLGIKRADWTDKTAEDIKNAALTCAVRFEHEMDDQGYWRPDTSLAAQRKVQSVQSNAREVVAENMAASEKSRRAYMRRLNECHARHSYLLYTAQHGIVDAFAQLASIDANMERERRVAKASGVIDMLEMRRLGEMKVQTQDALAHSWDEYRRLGGPDRTIDQVTQVIPNPCASIE